MAPLYFFFTSGLEKKKQNFQLDFSLFQLDENLKIFQENTFPQVKFHEFLNGNCIKALTLLIHVVGFFFPFTRTLNLSNAMLLLLLGCFF